MLSRINVVPLIRGHVLTLSNKNKTGTTPDYVMRLGLPGVAVAVGICAWQFAWNLPSASALLAGVALLGGASLSSFAYMSSLRLRLTDRPDDLWLNVERDSLDEGVTHILLVILLSILDAVLIVIGTNASPLVTKQGAAVPGTIGASVWAYLALAVAAYIALLFLVLVPRLYSAYVEMNHVRDELNGHRRMSKATRTDADVK